MKIYTKKGDQGQTGLLGGTRVPKHHLRIETYGTVDELNSWLGLLRDSQNIGELNAQLLRIQDRLFTLGSHLAMDPAKSTFKLPELSPSDTVELEKAIDEMEAQLPPLQNFILPGGCLPASHAHVARCVCRRAERLVVSLAETEAIPGEILPYLNRLSDYLFVVARYITLREGGEENAWMPER